jgi:transposase
MPYNFLPCNRDQAYLLPPSVRDWLPENHPAWFVIDAVEQMDLSALYARHRADGWGAAGFEPKMMTTLLLYAYCTGERSSRRIEMSCAVRRALWLCERDIAFRVIAANQRPDHSTISRFRQANGAALEGLFVDILRLCAEAGLVKLGMVALDGTKIKANAALSANRTSGALEEEVKKMLAEAAQADAKEDALYGKDRRGDELPEELQSRKGRLARLKECLERLAREASGKSAEAARKIEQRRSEEAATGKKKRGRKPGDPDAAVRAGAKANVSDQERADYCARPESRIKSAQITARDMKTAKGYVQGYNAQAVSTAEQIIAAADVTQEANDAGQPAGMLAQAQSNAAAVGMAGKIGTGLMDAGYWSEKNVEDLSGRGAPEVLIATTKDWKQRKALRECSPPRGRVPKHLGARERMERKLLTKRGRALYRLRSQTIEPIFGQIKTVRGCDRFMRRGHEAARSEWRLICGAHNLPKLFRSGKAGWN